MNNTTYSFGDYNITILSPLGSYSAQGKGLGSLSSTKTNDDSARNIGADGSSMISKIAGWDGDIVIEVQQTSDLNNWLRKLYNFLKLAPSNLWTSINITITNSVQKEIANYSGVCFQKRADQPRQAEGQMVSWNMMAQHAIEE